MADSTILLLPAASALLGSETLPLVQAGVTKRETLNTILAPAEKTANKGVAGGYPSLDMSGLVPASQLPSYIDDVVEYANIGAFPAAGVAGIIYVSLAANLTYRWSGTIYVKLNDGSVTSFNSRLGAVLPMAGDYTKADVGLSNVDNTNDLAKPISTAQAMVNALKADQLITIAKKTANHTFVLTDAGKHIPMNLAVANTVTVPLNATVNLPLDREILVSQYGVGQTEIVAPVGVTIHSIGNARKIAEKGGAVSLLQIAIDEWYMWGALEQLSSSLTYNQMKRFNKITKNF